MSRRRILFLVIIFVLLVVAAIISYYIPTNTWKEYTNDAWGVSFHYPSSFEKKEYHAAEVAFLGPGGTIDLQVLPQKLELNTRNDFSEGIELRSKTLVGDRVGYTSWQRRDDCNERLVQTALGARTLRIAFIACKGEQYPIDRDTTFINRVLKTFRFVDRGSGWKKYRSTAYGYSVDYPEDYTIEESGNVVGFFAPWEIATRAMPNYTDQPLGYYIATKSTDPKNSLEYILGNMYKDCGFPCTTTPITIGIDKLKGYRVHEAGLADGSYTHYVKNGENIFSFTIYWGFEAEEADSTFNQMLNSFHLE